MISPPAIYPWILQTLKLILDINNKYHIIQAIESVASHYTITPHLFLCLHSSGSHDLLPCSATQVLPSGLGLSSWSRRVGRRIDQLRAVESCERLQYSVTSDEPEERTQHQHLTRRVSRVESLRRLILGASTIDSKRLFDRKKNRYKVDKSIGTEAEYNLTGSEDDMFDRSSSQFDVSCDSFDLDSISQVSLSESCSTSVADIYKSSLPHQKSLSTDNIPGELTTFHR